MGAKISSVFSAAQIRGFQWWSNYCGCPEPQNPPGCGGQTENGIDFCALVDDGVATPCGSKNSNYSIGLFFPGHDITFQCPSKLSNFYAHFVVLVAGYYNSWFEDGCLARPSPPPICYAFDWCVYNDEDKRYYFYIDFTNV